MSLLLLNCKPQSDEPAALAWEAEGGGEGHSWYFLFTIQLQIKTHKLDRRERV